MTAVKCQSLTEQFTMENTESHIRFSGSNGLVVDGTSVALKCTSSELLLVQFGPNTTTCNSDGQWEPDPTTVECVGEGSKVFNYYCDDALFNHS